MNETELTQQLAAFEPPDLDGARERARLAARVEVAARGRPERPSVRPPAMAAAAALFLVVFVTGFASPPGQALASWLAERIGIGEAGGPPTLREFREFAAEGTIADGMPAYVLASGPAPGGHYQFLTFRSKEDGAHCFEFNLPEEPASYGGGCELLPAKGGVLIDSAGSNLGQEEGLQFVVGRVSDDVDSVTVEFDDRAIETEVTPVVPALLDSLGFDRPFKVLVAFIPEFERGGSVDVTGLDESGRELGNDEIEIPDFASLCAGIERRSGGPDAPPVPGICQPK